MNRRSFLAGAAMTTLGLAAEGGAQGRDELRAVMDEGSLTVRAGGQPVLTYNQKPLTGPPGTGPLFARGAYIHPLHAPNGTVVTGDFPPSGHVHQRAVFFAWTKTRIDDLEPDFWNLGAGTGRIVSRRVTARTDTGQPARFQATHQWEMRRGDRWEPVLDEVWEVVVRPPRFTDPQAPDAAYIVDLTSRQTPRVTIDLPQYRYGGMCVRGSNTWMARNSPMQVLTSEGKDWKTAENTRGRWADMYGPLEGKTVGVALMEHPSTFRAPNLLRIPPELPYVIFSPPKAESLKLDAGREFLFRYRIVAHNGPADAARLEALWKDFAAG